MMSHITRLVGLAVVASAAAAAPAGAETLLKTDATWRVSSAAPGTGWNTSTAFDASAWQSATTLYAVSDYLGPSYSALAIWSSGGQFSTTETAVWARQVLNLSAMPTQAAMRAGFDDDADLWINGTLVISDHNGVANNVDVPNLLPYLHVGSNLIAFAATDNYRVYGYNHSAWVQIDGQLAPTVPEPASLGMMLAGLAATAAVARRRKSHHRAACRTASPAAHCGEGRTQ